MSLATTRLAYDWLTSTLTIGPTSKVRCKEQDLVFLIVKFVSIVIIGVHTLRPAYLNPKSYIPHPNPAS